MAPPPPVSQGARAARRRSQIKQQRQRRTLAVGAVVLLLLGAFVATQAGGDGGDGRDGGPTTEAAGGGGRGGDGGGGGGGGGGTTSTTAAGPVAPRQGEWVNPASSGRPWSAEVQGLLTFRGNPTRSFYGKGPMPERPEVRWSYPGDGGGMCGQSSVGGETQTWCGTGWTGQPAVFEGPDGRRWVAFGAYDKAVHVVDGETGADIKAPFPLGDIIKGSVTIDPDGFPLLYTGSRDGYFHVLALDRGDQMEELYRLSAEAVSPTKWNDDWDSSALVIDDYLFEGGENSQIHIVKLNRSRDAEGKVTVDPQLVFNAPGWDDELISALSPSGSRANDVSIENSVAISGNTLYFANSGGLVQGWDLSSLRDGGTPQRTFRFWTGDDVDASIVIDGEGFLYVASEYERGLARAGEVGQLIKLDPRQPDDPVVWSVDSSSDQGIWATPAIHEGIVYATTNGGRLLGVRADTGEIAWEKDLAGGKTWQSPVVVDDVLVQGDCEGRLRGYDVSEPGVDPPELWTVPLEGCIESTPGVWNGWIYVGTRAGRFYAIH